MTKTLSKRIITPLNHPYSINGQQQHLSASIGISLCLDHGEDANTLIDADDTAMYIEKKWR